MRFCPKCRSEYELSATVCPDCNTTLVEHLTGAVTPTAVRPDGSWVGICRAGGQIRPETVKGALDSNNIPSIVVSSAFDVRDGEADQASGFSSMISGGDVVMVPSEFRREAELILEIVLGDDLDDLVV